MGMPITVDIVDKTPDASTLLETVFTYFSSVDERFSPFKETSEVSRYNRGELDSRSLSIELWDILQKCEQTKRETDGYFDIAYRGSINPSGLVKGWAIQNAAEILRIAHVDDFVVEAGGDVQIGSVPHSVGIRHPFEQNHIVKVVTLEADHGIATSGRQFRGDHIYNPRTGEAVSDIASLSIIAQNVYEADRFATAAFAMGKQGIYFVENIPDIEGYLIDNDGIATFTSGWERYVT
jgi:thiamine biosynthesis lipoprotein